jgi:hypothetical protein
MLLRASIVVSLLAMGCGVGEDDFEPVKEDPNPQRLVCSDAFTLTGTFTPGTPARPTDMNDPAYTLGCWPVGTWTFTATRDATDERILDITGDGKPERCGAVPGTQAAALDASYTLNVSRVLDNTPGIDGYVESYAIAGGVKVGSVWNGKEVYRLKVTEGGGGDCEGGVELLSEDRKMLWNFKPSQEGTVIKGFGEFAAYQEPQP